VAVRYLPSGQSSDHQALSVRERSPWRYELALAALILFGTILVAGVLSASASTVSSAKLQSDLITINQMPVGWSVEKVSGATSGCTAQIPSAKGLHRVQHANEKFEKNSGGNFDEELVTYSAASKTAYSRIVDGFRGCRHVRAKLSGETWTASFEQTSFPRYGNQSSAFVATFQSKVFESKASEFDYIVDISRFNKIIMVISLAFDGTNYAQFENTVSTATRRIEGGAPPTEATVTTTSTTTTSTTTTTTTVPPPSTTTTTRPPPPPTTTAPPPSPPTTAAPASCYPIDDEGGCYEPGEYCRDDDHGVTGRAGDGETITCEDNDGWRWEPT
jgi:hypothetical protein